jgi:hypothetical protein
VPLTDESLFFRCGDYAAVFHERRGSIPHIGKTEHQHAA